MRSLLLSVLTFFLFLPVAAAEIKELPTLARLDAFLNPETVVIFDLDNTVIESETALGGDQWFSRLVQDYVAAGHAEREAKDLAVTRWQRLQPLVRTRAVEAGTPALIAALRARGLHVIGLTARPKAVRLDTRRQLADVGVDFSVGQTADHGAPADGLCFTLEVESCFYDGILFVNNSDKGKALLRLAAELDWRLRDVVMIDDKLHNVEAVDAALNAWNVAHPAAPIRHVELRYGAADARVAAYDHDLATLQERLVTKILSDDEASDLRDGCR